MPEYRNPWPHTVELIGPIGERIRIKSGQHRTLDIYYDKYVARGYISNIGDQQTDKHVARPVMMHKLKLRPTTRSTAINIPHIPSIQPIQQQKAAHTEIIPSIQPIQQQKAAHTEIIPTSRGIKQVLITPKPLHSLRSKQVVGRPVAGDGTQIYHDNLAVAPYRISNGVGIGVLSYNRGDSLYRLVQSIKHTVNLDQTVLFISDDNSTDANTLRILDEIQKDPRIVIIRNTKNAGIAVNSNRLLRCLSRFDHMFLCNDDVEFIAPQWTEFYINNAKKAGLHHLCYHQHGVYGATLGVTQKLSGVDVHYIVDKPHGAMLYMTSRCLRTIGYFDTKYERYGMEHVDWSLKPAEFNLQPSGFYDLVGSANFVKIHAEPTAIQNKQHYLSINRALFADRQSQRYVPVDDESVVPKISYVIPYRDIGRTSSIKSVIMNTIGQSFPEIEIWAVEQDTIQRFDYDVVPTVNHLYVNRTDSTLFNKSAAFNAAVNRCTAECVVLHDADMLSRTDYTQTLFNTLQKHEIVHLCGRVIYINKECTEQTDAHGHVARDVVFERIINYFEGGSLAANVKAYWRYGGFNEDYRGYGVEDCDFYLRASSSPTWLCTTEFDLVHLWHDRLHGWHDHHKYNLHIQAGLSTLTVGQRIGLQHKQLTALGYGLNLV